MVSIKVNGTGQKNKFGGYSYITSRIKKNTLTRVYNTNLVNSDDEFFNPLTKSVERIYIGAYTKEGFGELSMFFD